ncbi:NADPH-dependent FMN reductase [Nocardioides sp. GXZ039]|uniref:NADPH-dependent FMN reductase n=1 Tax=Nocardioides sp. GXZ039 TaxID=3136018 RepID=UPI0030F3C434
MRIAIVIGSTRPGRRGREVGEWVYKIAAERDDATYELVDLLDFDLTLLAEETLPGAANRQYENPNTRRWSETVDSYDGFVWVTAEYNHGVPAALKNAFDLLSPEWNHKAVGLVAYGADGGVRAVEQWRGILANAHMVVVRAQLSLSIMTEWTEAGFTPNDRRAGELESLLDQVVTMTRALEPVRAGA